MDEASPEIKLKLLVIGDGSVGKTSLTLRLAKQEFVFSHIHTIGVDVQHKEMTIDGETVLLQIVTFTQWDTAGQERYRAIHAQYYRQAHGVMLVYDTSSPESFAHLDYWMQTVKGYVTEKLPVLLVGNKCDLDGRVVTSEEAENFAKAHNICHMETSAKDNLNVELAFQRICEMMLKALRVHKDIVPQLHSLRLKNADRYTCRKRGCLCQRSRVRK